MATKIYTPEDATALNNALSEKTISGVTWGENRGGDDVLRIAFRDGLILTIEANYAQDGPPTRKVRARAGVDRRSAKQPVRHQLDVSTEAGD
jgi:hypothetical protein